MKWRRYFIPFVAFIYFTALFITPQSVDIKRSPNIIGVPRHVFGDGFYYIKLTKALAMRGELHVHENIKALEGWYRVCGLSLGSDGRIYIAFSPGISLLATPFYIIGGIPMVYFLNALLGVLTVYFIYRCCMLFVSHETAVKTALVFAFCTTIFTYSQVFYAEALALFLAAASFFYLNLWVREKRWTSIVVSGLLAGALPMTKPTLALMAGVFAAWLAVERDWRGLILFTAAMIPLTTVFLAYNTIGFGGPFKTSYSRQIIVDENGDYTLRDLTDKSFWTGNAIKVFAGRIILIVITQPILIVSFTGLIRNYGVREVKIVLLASLLLLGVYSFRTNPLGVWCWSDRLFTPAIPLLSIPFALSVEKKQVREGVLGVLIYTSLYLTAMSLDTGSWDVFSQLPLTRWITS
jgi:4-amino-4-deoxy-L-arabinose transferase-like glycosyltransferase